MRFNGKKFSEIILEQDPPIGPSAPGITSKFVGYEKLTNPDGSVETLPSFESEGITLKGTAGVDRKIMFMFKFGDNGVLQNLDIGNL
jgi:hypothetical protein